MEMRSVFLICTVGGSSQPVVTSMLHWQPMSVVFVATEQTGVLVEREIVPTVTEQGMSFDAGRYETLLLHDGQDFTRCVEQMRELVPKVSHWLARGSAFEVAVDFTGGTKCMSAALSLHAHRWKCRFTYIGGHQRTKDGVGIVVSGSEEVIQTVNPWDALGFQAVADYAKLFDEGAFASASRAVDQVMRNVSEPSRKRELGMLKNLAEAYQAWDQFNHEVAGKRLGDARRAGNDLSAALCDPVAAKRLLTTLECHSNLLKEIIAGSRMAVVKDLLANARRRMAEMRWDDATARLYRAIEATAQARLQAAHQIVDTKHIELECLPKALREAWQGRAKNGLMMVGLQDAYALLHELHDPLGSKFYSLELAGKRSPLTARNDSILAHGFKPITKKACTALWQCALALVDCAERDLYQFPLLGGYRSGMRYQC